MEKRKKTGGRQKGTLNKAKSDITEKLASMGCDPIVGMARIALDCEKELQILDNAIADTDDALIKADNIRCKNQHIIQAGNMYKELAQYVAPKKRAMEHSGSIDTGSIAEKLSELKQLSINAEQST